MVWWKLGSSKQNSALPQEEPSTKWGTGTTTQTAQERFSNLPMDEFASNSKNDLKTTFDDDEFEDIDSIKKKMGMRVVKDDEPFFGERAKTCGVMIVASSLMGVCIGLASGSLIGAMMAPPGHKFATAIRMMKTQSVWFGIFFSAGGLVGCGKKYF